MDRIDKGPGGSGGGLQVLRIFLRERRRSAAVRSLDVLGSPAEPGFDRFVNEAASAFNAPYAFLSLIRDDVQWIKAGRGMEIACVPRRDGFCQNVLGGSGVLESCDPRNDPRFADLSVVREEPFVRYYAGAPLRLMNNVDVGALCVLDSVARRPASADQRAYLLGLARQASLMLETRSDLRRVGAAA